MDFKKCVRCGCFFLSADNVCCNCKPKDTCDNLKLKCFLSENASTPSLEELSIDTGISTKNLTRYIEDGSYNDCVTDDKKGTNNVSINL